MFRGLIRQYKNEHGFGAFCPKAVLFDMDGVIFDSMPNHARSWHLAMKECGIDMAESEAYQYEGMRGVETIKLKAREQWHRELSDDEAQSMYDVKARYFSACPKAQKMEGVVALMQQIKAAGLKICVVTGSGQRSLLDHLEQEFPGLVSRELMVTSYDVKHGKPSPEPYLAGLQKAGVQPWEAIVVENAPLGVRAAVAANIFTVAVNTGPLPDEMLTDEGAHVVFHRMTDFSKQWQKLISEANELREIKKQEQRWQEHYAEVMQYMLTHRQRPSKHRMEHRHMINWIKFNKKRLAAGKMSEERRQQFLQLLNTAQSYQRLNQYAYRQPPQQLSFDF